MRVVKVIGWGFAIVVVLGVIGSQLGGNGDKPAGDSGSAASGETVTGRVDGAFRRNCLLCDQRLAKLVRTSDAWCGWQGAKVVVHVTMRNESAEHLTVNWHPSYVIANGGEHGAGLTSVESSGFDAGETRSLLAEQDPKGVSEGAAIEECKPSFSTVESG